MGFELICFCSSEHLDPKPKWPRLFGRAFKKSPQVFFLFLVYFLFRFVHPRNTLWLPELKNRLSAVSSSVVLEDAKRYAEAAEAAAAHSTKGAETNKGAGPLLSYTLVTWWWGVAPQVHMIELLLPGGSRTTLFRIWKTYQKIILTNWMTLQ